MSKRQEIDKILTEFTSGSIAADECFCLILSLCGLQEIESRFLTLIQGLRPRYGELYNRLCNVYMGYFDIKPSQIPSFLPDLDRAVENGYYATDYGSNNIGFELDMELALKLSEQEYTALNNGYSKAQTSKSPGFSSKPPGFSSNPPGFSSKPPGFSYAGALKTGSNPMPVTFSAAKPLNNQLDNVKHTYTPVKTVDQLACNSKDKTEASGTAEDSIGQNSDVTEKPKQKRKKKKNRVDRPLSNPSVIFWFRRDLRVYDNPALVAASQSGAPVIPIFLWSDREEGPQKTLATGAATKYWLYMALPKLNSDLNNQFNNSIIYRKADNYLNELLDLFKSSGAKTLIINDVYEPFLKSRDDKICSVLKSKGIKCERHHSYLLHEPGTIKTESLCMRGMGSVTHFMEMCRQCSTSPIGLPIDPPECLPAGTYRPESMPLEMLDLGKLPKRKDGTVIDWAKIIRESWDFSETGAWEALQLFLNDGVRRYEKESSRGDQLNTCRISPYLHFGQISPRTVLCEGRHMKSPKFLRKLAWRDLSYWMLSVLPDLPSEPSRPQYIHQRWSQNKTHLKAWQKGNTGYPLVDAPMRQLWLTGWMNNYMRHVVASFLISYLHISWVEGYLWFQDTLLDADVAINAMMWQNGGMSGLDQWNFVMHPVDAAMTCDPKGDYVRKWVPELAKLHEDFIHQPWKAPPSILRRAGIELGVNYPHRIITELEEAREQSLRDVVEVRQKFPEMIDPKTGNDLVRLPSGVRVPVITRKEFKYKTSNPDGNENPHNAVLRGYRGRKRDELVEFFNQRDFLASTMKECTSRHENGLKQMDLSFL
ncbi:deoxyribodipyrimidine photo-lyase-like [Dreissena polymorpha]|uniref:Photolyase/cryptochrome alpha/beta domain-containing protein n=1 Tax=Dreissena polymorpha TaxID=45954 RepID=A0A9D4EGJ2_DREPO|nr:deoxyribodipyrimidine photo-lyase-like [Dreissena polymorpha]KAH3779326.1 hypothetical protein DPMN_157129 [Dreissena polymorpha]